MRGPVRDRLRVRRSRLFPGAAVIAFALVVPSASHAVTVVESIGLNGSADSARLTIGTTGPAKATVFALAHPDRIVVDLKAATLDRRRAHLPAADGLVRRVRVGPRDGTTLRIVLEVEHRAAAHIVAPAARDDGRRLVIEIGTPEGERNVAPAALPAAGPLVAERTAPRTTRDLVIAVDAGHGGDDPGATGRDGTREKDVTLAVARALATRINAEPAMRAVLTRDRDVFVPLPERVQRAHDARADLFVSVHADAIADRKVTGASVYVLSQRGASSETAKLLADRENAAVLIGARLPENDDVVASVLVDLVKSQAMSDSMEAAGKVLEQLNEVGEVRKAKVQQAGFVVLKAAAMPSMLIESAYITNPGEERRLRDPRHQAQLAEAILAGLRNYFRENPPPGTRMAALVVAARPPAGDALGASPRSLQR